MPQSVDEDLIRKHRLKTPRRCICYKQNTLNSPGAQQTGKSRHRYKKLYGHFFFWFKTLIGSSKSTLFYEDATFPWQIFQINYIILLYQDLSHCCLHTLQLVTACKTMLKYFYHCIYFFLCTSNSLSISNRSAEISPK